MPLTSADVPGARKEPPAKSTAKKTVARKPRAARRKRVPKPRGGVYVATTSGSAEIKGQVYPFTKDVTRVREGHALLKLFAGTDTFKPVGDDVHYDVEKATRAPGEKRGE